MPELLINSEAPDGIIPGNCAHGCGNEISDVPVANVMLDNAATANTRMLKRKLVINFLITDAIAKSALITMSWKCNKIITHARTFISLTKSYLSITMWNWFMK